MRKTIVCFLSLLLASATAVGVHAGPPVQDQLASDWAQEAPPAGTVTIGFRPASVAVIPDRVFMVEIVFDATSQEVDSAQVAIDFDANYLTVVDEAGEEASEITAGKAMPDPLYNTVDNSLGRIAYAAGYVAQGAVLQRPFVLATVRFRAQELTPGTDISFYFRPAEGSGDNRIGTKVKIGATSVPIHAITNGLVRIYVHRLVVPLVLKGNFH